MKKVKWGILGAGGIAHKFAADFCSAVTNGELCAVASRNFDKAGQFANKYNITNIHGNYESLVADKDIDIIYIATTHNFHYNHILLCLNNGKHVLCEKPITLNAKELDKVAQLAGQKKLFIMEAMWTRFLPTILQAQQWAQQGLIGDIEVIQANFGIDFPYNPQGRLYNINLAGGALLDIGIYILTIADVFAQSDIETIDIVGKIGETGIDEQVGLQIVFKNKIKAQLFTSIKSRMINHACIYGPKGYIEISDFWMTKQARLVSNNYNTEYIDKTPEMGYNHEAQAVGDCILKGLTQCPQMPIAYSQRILTIMDKIRDKLGLQYPLEIK